MSSFEYLDNPIWSALTQRHEHLATRFGLAARYSNDVSSLVGLAEPSRAAFDNLRELVAPMEQVALFTADKVDVPANWTVVRERIMDQMICRQAPPADGGEFAELSTEDVPQMIALTSITKPGPFLARTIITGTYLGVREERLRLVAMAGQRLSLDDAVEMSAVCTHPDFSGRGYARRLVAASARSAFESGRQPFLHVKTENGARRVYAALGFEVRQAIHLTVVSPAAP